MDTEIVTKAQWSAYSALTTGINHEKRELLCQDRVCYRASETGQIIALADGISQEDINIIGVEKVLEKLCAAFLRKDIDVINGTKDDIKRAVIMTVQREIERLARDYHVKVSAFASTLLLFYIDLENKHYCAVHLGDGIILCKQGKAYGILSYPENGPVKKQTCLTTSPYAYQYLKVMRGAADGLSEVGLLSDGTYEFPISLPDAVSVLNRAAESPYNLVQKMDDQSVILLRKEQVS